MIAIQDLQFVEQSNSQVEGGITPLPAVSTFAFGSNLIFNVSTIGGQFQSTYSGTLVSSVFLGDTGFIFPAVNSAGFTSSNTVSFG